MRETFDGVQIIDSIEDWLGPTEITSRHYATINKFGLKYELSVFDVDGNLLLTSDPIFPSERSARKWLKLNFGSGLPTDFRGEEW